MLEISNRLQHTDEEREEFWDFNTGSIGVYDIPSMVGKIIEETAVDEFGGGSQTCNKV